MRGQRGLAEVPSEPIDAGEEEPCDPEQCPGCWYGIAPHVGMLPGVGHLNATIDRRFWPSNFTEDQESPGAGMYHCPKCCDCDASEVR